MIRCVRIWTGPDEDSHFEDGTIDLPKGERGDVLGDNISATSVSFRETRAGGDFAWHDAPVRQLVVTLAGRLEFKVKSGETFIINAGDMLLAEDTTGSGHSWRLTNDEPWRRAYVILTEGVAVPFVKTP